MNFAKCQWASRFKLSALLGSARLGSSLGDHNKLAELSALGAAEFVVRRVKLAACFAGIRSPLAADQSREWSEWRRATVDAGERS